jgi:uncharacterized protein (TIGR02996 family)
VSSQGEDLWDEAVTGEYGVEEWKQDQRTPADPDTPVEMRFVLRLRDNPDDLAMRMVYADWLEERGQAQKAEVVRLLAEPPAEGTPAMARLRLAVVSLPGDWVATVGRAPIERCGVEMKFKCPMAWEALASTDNSNIRHCGECKRNVYFCGNIDEVRYRGQRGDCVAFSPRLVRARAIDEYDGLDEPTPNVLADVDDDADGGTTLMLGSVARVRPFDD